MCTVLCLVRQSCLTLCSPMGCSPPGSSVHGDSLGKHLGGGCPALLQGNFTTHPGIESRSPTLQAGFLLSSPPESPWTLEWVAYPFSRDQSGVSCMLADSLPAELPGKPTQLYTYSYINTCDKGDPEMPQRKDGFSTKGARVVEYS